MQEPHRILVVDDERPIADTLCQILRKAGYECRPAYSGTDALLTLSEFSPALIISDVVMPGLDGIEMAKTVRRECPACAVLLFSGNASTQDLLANAHSEGYSFQVLAKPLPPRELLTKVAALLSPLREVRDAENVSQS
jgi:DNA-binding response OmpR family regulator